MESINDKQTPSQLPTEIKLNSQQEALAFLFEMNRITQQRGGYTLPEAAKVHEAMSFFLKVKDNNLPQD